MPLNQIQAGVQTIGDGLVTTARAGKQADTIVSELHGRYYEQTYRGNMFYVANQAGVTTTVGLATTYTGLCLSNPIGSGVNLVLNKCTVGQNIIQAVVNVFGLAFGFNSATNVTHTTPQAPQSNLIGIGTTAKAKADVSATLPTAPLYGPLPFTNPTATTDVGGLIDLEGSVILIPGAYAIWASPAASSAVGMWFSFSWEEVPV